MHPFMQRRAREAYASLCMNLYKKIIDNLNWDDQNKNQKLF